MWRNKDNFYDLQDALKTGKDFIVFDTETTGLSADKNEIIQISAIKLQNQNGTLTEIDRFDRYIKPIEPVPVKITELTGISNELLEEESYLEDVFPDIFEFFGTSPIIVAYNSSFDVRFLKAAYSKVLKSFIPEFELDVLKMAKDLVPKDEVENHKLGTIVNHFCLGSDLTFHNSMDDVIATTRLLEVFKKMYLEEDFQSTVVDEDAKPKVAVHAIRFWKGYRGFSRIYVNTSKGDLYYDIRKKEWDGKTLSPNEINMNDLIEQCLTMASADSVDNFVSIIRKDNQLLAS